MLSFLAIFIEKSNQKLDTNYWYSFLEGRSEYPGLAQQGYDLYKGKLSKLL